MISRFDVFEVDRGQVELRRSGVRLAVEPQVFSLLVLLIDHRDRMVSKDEIMAAVWGGRIVSDSALSSRIKSARQALGDDGSAQRWIRTVHGQGFRFVGQIEDGDAGEAAAHPPAELAAMMARPLVAVFPFEQEEPNPQDAYFVDGVAEDLMAELSAWRWFPVLSRNAAFDASHRGRPAAERASALGARYALAGRMHRAGRQARLSIELVDAASGAQLWSGRFERDLADLMAMQAEIAAAVFQRIAPELKAAERRRILRKAPVDLSAWDMTLKALWALNQPSQEGFAGALAQLETATRLDPAQALPWSLISLIRFESALQGWVGGDMAAVREPFGQMLAAARRAVEIDPSGWMGHALASVGELYGAASYGRARAHADQALDLNPAAGMAQHFSGCIFGFGGDPAAAVAVQSQVYRVDPDYLHADVIEADLGLWALVMGDHEAAERHLLAAKALNPGNLRVRQRLLALAGRSRDRARARTELDGFAALGGVLTADYVAASYPFQDRDQARLFTAGLKAAGVRLG